MEKRELTCIGCPMGCALTVTMNGKEILEITGNTCKHGAEYAAKEVTNPTRVLTTTVRIQGQKGRMLSVKTRTDIPKDKLLQAVKDLRKVEATLPVAIGDVVAEDIAHTGVDVIATKAMN